MSGPARVTVLNLYRQMLKASKSFNSYNFREYSLRRTREEFRTNKNVTDPAALASLISKAKENLEVIQRQALINKLYVKEKSILEV